MEQVFNVQGMTCGHCERAVQQALRGVDAQVQVQVDRAANQVVVHSNADREALAQAIREEGFQVAA